MATVTMTHGDKDLPQRQWEKKAGKSDQNWKKIQERTFTNWFNDRLRGHLKVAKRQIVSLEIDLVDGIMLIELMEKLASPKSIGRYTKNPTMKLQMIENLGKAMNFIKEQNIKLVNIGPEDLHNGNLKLILGLIWTLIKEYQIKVSAKGISTKKAMLGWINSIIPEYGIGNFTTDWNDGRALCGTVDYIRPGSCPNHQALNHKEGLENCTLGIDLAERMLNIPKVMDPEDLNNPDVDDLSVMTYVSYFCEPANALLLNWIRKKIPEQNIQNLSTDWNNGINLGALADACFPGLCPEWPDMLPTNAIENNTKLYKLIKNKLGIEPLVSPAEFADPKLDELIVATYLSAFRTAKLHASPEEFSLRVPSLPKGSALVKEPVKFGIELSQQSPDLVKEIKVTAHGPSSSIPVGLKANPDGNLEATFVPTEAGSYDIMAVYQDENITGSPFSLPVADPTKCDIFGDIPKDLQKGKPTEITVKTRGAGVGKLACTFDGKGKSSVQAISSEVVQQENDQFGVKLNPEEIGEALVELKWADVDIPKTPFKVNVVDATKVKVVGNDLLGGEGRVGDAVKFKVIAKKRVCGVGALAIKARGPSANYTADVKEVPGGDYDVSFVPWEIGPHKVDVEFGEEAVPKSPFSLNVKPAPDANTCSASGKGLKKAISGEPTDFIILSPEKGLLERKDPAGLDIVIESATEKAKVDIEDNNDGTYKVTYTAAIPGDYDTKIKFYGKHIPGSPFKLAVVPAADASKCNAYGPALHPNSLHIAGNPLDLFVDTKEAGTGELQVTVKGPDDSKPKVFMANDDGIYSLKWDVPDPGKYYVHIWWSQVYIPGSPFKVRVQPGPNAGLVKAYGPGLANIFEIGTSSSDFTVETKNAGIGTLTVRVHGVKGAFKIQAEPKSEDDPRTLSAYYHPKEAGDYIIAIRWSGTHVPGSPFNVNVRFPPDTSKERKDKKKHKSKPQAPHIYYSQPGTAKDPEVAAGMADLYVDEDAKKKKSKVKKQTSKDIEEATDGDEIIEQQLAQLSQRRAQPVGFTGGAIIPGAVTTTTTVTQTRQVKKVEKKQKKKKRF